MAIERLPGARRLAVDYAQRTGRLEPFFAGHPTDAASWSAALARIAERTYARDALAALLAAQQTRRDAPTAAHEAARRLADRSTVAVVTGQQAGLFGGPLYTLLKAVTTIQLAREVTRLYQVPAVPVFWIDAEDHDWDEVCACTVLDAQLAPHTIRLSGHDTPAPRPVAAVRLDASITDALEALERALAPTEFRDGLLASLRDAYVPGRGMAEAFARWLERLLGPLGLVVYEASDPAGKPLAGPLFQRELTTAPEASQLARRAGDELEAQGYHAQVKPVAEAVALFRLDGGRVPIRRQDGGFAAADEHFPLDALIRQAGERPDRFSPNVLLRPIVQDAIFPTVAYVAGPNELAYLAQLRRVYEHFNVPMPIMYPRTTATLIDQGAAKFLARHAVELGALRPDDDATLNALLARAMPDEVEHAFVDARDAIDARLARLIEALPQVDPTLAGAAETTRKRMEQDLGTLHAKTIQAAKRRDETLRRQFSRTRALVFPNGHLQERTIGFVSFLNQYGPTLIDRLVGVLPLELGKHWLVTV